MNREEAQARVESLGGVFVSGVTSKTDILVCGDGGGGKRTKAESLGVSVMEASAFLAL
jgi:DNA ligase (NAD+)